MIKKIIAVAITVFPLLAFADVTIINNTNSYATGATDLSPCSSTAGDYGIVKPHSNLAVGQDVLNLWCSLSTCKLHVFMSKSCTGKHIATISIEAKKGVTNVDNRDPQHFNFSWTANTITANANTDEAKKPFLSWLNWK